MKLTLRAIAALLALGLPPGAAGSTAALEFLEQRVEKDADDFIAWNQLAARRLQLLRQTGDLEHLPRAAAAAQASLKALPPEQNPGGLTVRARVEMAGHRFGAARDSAKQLIAMQLGKSPPLLLLGDALLELGDYEEAAAAFEKAAALDGSTVDLEARLARLDVVHGRQDSAKEHLEAALTLARELGIPSPDTVQWCHLQLGQLSFKAGDLDAADRQYQAALRIAPENPAALDHLAELRAAQGQNDEAVAIYSKLVDRHPRPEFLQALGDLHSFLGRADEARPWHERALAEYTRSVDRSEVLYFHHLAGFHADSQPDPAKAVEWARKDLELRQSIFAYDALAWALYKKGELPEAQAAMEKALRTGVKDAHVLHHAGLIRMSAGDLAGGRAALQDAVAANPRHNTFHVHR